MATNAWMGGVCLAIGIASMRSATARRPSVDSRRSTSAICVRISCSFGGIASSICSSSAATARSASLSSSATGCRAVSAVASCCSALRTRSPAANASGSPA
ncbi:hypothetical protein G6F54_014182 [Rhizopus delemar]|nr:hypothetical protein G6F54_014182 [Rhizopus delemar]